MDYTQLAINTQSKNTIIDDGYLKIPNTLTGFINTDTEIEDDPKKADHKIIVYKGIQTVSDEDRICECCGAHMYKNMICAPTRIKHFSYGPTSTVVEVSLNQMQCTNPECNATKMQGVPFKSKHHRITKALEEFIEKLLGRASFTLKSISELTGVGKNIVKAIDLRRLKRLYTVDGKTLRKPQKFCKYLGIDEFKLHNGYKYATHIIDMETGNVLWIARGKSKQVVYDFIDYVGEEWMDHVEAIGCDMNSDFEEAFEERCTHIQPVFDYFHIVKNMNEKLINEIRKDEQARLIAEGNMEAAKHLKKSKHVLCSKKATRDRKDEAAQKGIVKQKKSDLFNLPEIKAIGGWNDKFDLLIKENELLFKADLIKEKITAAYQEDHEWKMAKQIIEIIDLCNETKNEDFIWFANLLSNHFEGIIAHATIKITSSKIEGINNRIKTIRRMGYGYPDDEYFFLKIIDMSRRNPL